MSSHFMAPLKCFHLNHYWATWVVGINLPLCSPTVTDHLRVRESPWGLQRATALRPPTAYGYACLSRQKLCFLTMLCIGSCYSVAFFTHSVTISPPMYLLQWTHTSPLLKLLSVKKSWFPSYGFPVWAPMCQALGWHFAFIISFGS